MLLLYRLLLARSLVVSLFVGLVQSFVQFDRSAAIAACSLCACSLIRYVVAPALSCRFEGWLPLCIGPL